MRLLIKCINVKKIILIIITSFFITTNSFSEQSKFNETGPDAKVLGEKNSFSPCRPYSSHWKKKECRIGNFSQTDKIINNRRFVFPSNNAARLPYAKNYPPKLINTVDKYVSKHPVMGFLIVKNGEIITERYQYNRKPDMIFRSFSMTKTFIAMLIGIAHDKGLIKSLDDPVGQYWTEVKNSPYGKVTIKEVLRMASGVEGGSYADENSNAMKNKMYSVLFDKKSVNKPEKFEEYINNLKKRGSKGNFRYSNLDSMVLGRILNKVTGENISTLTSEWLWKPMGARSNAKWMYSFDGIETTEGGFSATLNDFARFGILLANNGNYKGTQVISKEYLLQATDYNITPKSHINVSNNAFQYAYGYQTWIQKNKERTFCALGHYTQIICVQPSSKIVMVQVAVNKSHDGWKSGKGTMSGDLLRLWKTVLEDLGGNIN